MRTKRREGFKEGFGRRKGKAGCSEMDNVKKMEKELKVTEGDEREEGRGVSRKRWEGLEEGNWGVRRK